MSDDRDTESKLVDRKLTIHDCLYHAQARLLPSLESVNQWRRSIGWEELTRFPAKSKFAADANKTDWRIGLAVTPSMKTHPWYRCVFVVRAVRHLEGNVHGTIQVEHYSPHSEIVRLEEPSQEWKTA